MPPFMSTSKALGSFMFRKNGFRHSIKSLKNSWRLQKFDQIQCISSIMGIETPSVRNSTNVLNDLKFSWWSLSNGSHTVQKRRFLGCEDGEDGEEGIFLSKVYEKRHVVGFSPEQLFSVVAAVDLYDGFVPRCQRSEIRKHYPDGSFDAELGIAFKSFVESYTSHVELNRPKSIKTTAKDSALFDHLINIWEFNPGPVPGSCELYFLVDFEFQSPLNRRVASMFFKEVVSRLGVVANELVVEYIHCHTSHWLVDMVSELINANPTVYEKKERRVRSAPSDDADEYAVEPIDQPEVFDILSLELDIKDPEHPYSLEELKVITEDAIEVDDKQSYVRVTFTPTVEHCSMATIIGLCLRVKLLRSLPSRYKIDIRVAPGSHASEAAVNKQLNDKERVAAALENPNLVDMVDECLAPSFG
ncbi:hypothetical protein FH972_012532 [Carpinus fangiana]|uniref:Coenzyme Q-binding protein COQ10 START domain-containing protein n=1 Tax=Carpinus fangiana TaxID=176857 RepID=A0A5N6R7E6_9ROSI|nr:hypothetical protein FH972_012532 [Carpinus fangiana]